MMTRSERRHRAARVRLKVWRRIWREWNGDVDLEAAAWGDHSRPLHWWRYHDRMSMSTPMWWTHEMMIVPARRRQNRALCVRREDWDEICWPDFKKPHIYYW